MAQEVGHHVGVEPQSPSFGHAMQDAGTFVVRQRQDFEDQTLTDAGAKILAQG